MPSKYLVVAAGVGLSDKNNDVSGPPIQKANRLSIKDYLKIADPNI